jgi:phage-related protein
MQDKKAVHWIGSSLKDLKAFPDTPRRDAGHELNKVQSGLEPSDWKPFDEVGAGTREIRIRDESGAYRVMYVAKKEIVATRYRAVVGERKEKK